MIELYLIARDLFAFVLLNWLAIGIIRITRGN